ncbi:serine hydrolase domain-containing protein [Bordetella pseudohinzii]|uniref:Beta-lactamase n=1 Tax=Bordetella pseudohinzii TaxID=1331258 RepID=A0A0J6BVA7_9BORD|nr:serine hydrolase [Bordetella pseudohinzii]ANY17477.1 serine hydrolase [Bordetella pseudohinzii]KMM25704.1 beta-lactamase [Bordetella pseudohinzii]KXA81694.1 serine hydrolase [Bordetella pseudohinzii]KXA83067.1 serine hydrolase [Bordetella pseudohinzii]CUI72073.1 Beta-lactamase [Bordetella pseudohinzii]
MNALMQEAIQFARDHESTWDRSVKGNWGVHQQDPAPYNRLLGPVHDRGPNSGVVRVDGKTLIEWGEPERADLTFSVAKLYLAILAGVAHDRGLLPDVEEPVRKRVPGIGFDAGQNAEITWRQLLQQTSEWEGERFGVPDQVDRYRAVTFGVPPNGKKGDARPLQRPGTYWEYNDVRINQLSYALLHLFRQPLPEVFREAVMRPIGASEDWQWVGYDNAWVEIDGKRMPSVPGGSHWGGGMSVSARDQALIGQMLLEEGRAQGRQVLSREWIQAMRQPVDIAPYYGYLIWLNHQRKMFPSLPESSFFGVGAGSSFTWVEPERRMVVIVRWLDSAHANELFGKILQAVDAG